MVHHEVHSSRKESKEMTSFEEINCDGESDRFTFRQRDTDDEIQGSMGPLIVGDWQRVKKELGFFDDLFWVH